MELPDKPVWKMPAQAASADAADAGDAPPRRKLSDRIWNALVGLTLAPFAWIFSHALYATFLKAANVSSAANVSRAHWSISHEFLMFEIGAAIWLAIFGITILIWKQPRPLRAYILGHELMHMLVARLFAGRIKKFHVSREGGYIVTDKYNFLIALAPYLWPFYSIPVLAMWSVSLYWKHEAWYYREAFLIALGFTWMFHLTFTLWVLPRGQSDLLGPGRIFSLIFIYLANVVLLSGALVSLAPRVSWRGYAAQVWQSARDFYVWALHSIHELGDFISRLVQNQTG